MNLKALWPSPILALLLWLAVVVGVSARHEIGKDEARALILAIEAPSSCPVAIIPAVFPKNLLNKPLPEILFSAVSSINFMCLVLRILFFGDFSLAGLRLPSKEMHLSMNVFIKLEILKLFTGVAKIIASAQRTLS